MTKALSIVFAALLSALVATSAWAADEAAAPTEIATRLLDHMDAGNYAAAEAMFTAGMAAAVPADKLQAVWESLPAQAGEARGRGEPEVKSRDGMHVVRVPLQHAKADLVASIAIDADGKVAGFLVQPAAAPAAAPPPADAGYEEREVQVGDGERALSGLLAMPQGDGPFPAVVLVHGSGPHDRDESIGPNRPFLDIARGLAAQGIAVLRFDKRTKVRPQDFADGTLTIDGETTDDAVAAVAALAATPGIDPTRIFVLGHSQGGMMAPRIAARAGAAGTPVAGLVLLAAPARKLLDILVEQNRRLAVLDDATTSVAEATAIDKLRMQVNAIRAASGDGDAAVAPGDTPLGLPAAYWRSTDAVDPVAEAEALALPMLVLQGARDIQVVDADWQRWKRAFHDDPKVTFKLYPALNHLAIAGEGPGSLAEYGTPGHVDAGLIEDVAEWIGRH
ncbi:alpha/beta hydrolase [Luteimonas vadosa]|uniref:Alpha/beta fold hydrolase n=1 Tax=Luteimonas vadosa TaxID=1165507 RepID=A0ABP9E2T4_9GAMM